MNREKQLDAAFKKRKLALKAIKAKLLPEIEAVKAKYRAKYQAEQDMEIEAVYTKWQPEINAVIKEWRLAFEALDEKGVRK